MTMFYQVPCLVLLTTLCCGQALVGGTLVVVVPANGGAVIASDTRTIVKGTTCDGHTKIINPKLRKNTVVFYTGNGNRISDPGEKSDICQHVETGTPLLDISKFLVDQVNLQPDSLLTIPELEQMSVRCLALLTEYSRTHGLDPNKDGSLFQGVIVTYDVEHERVLAGLLRFVAGAVGQPLGEPVEMYVFEKNEKADHLDLGETKYVKDRVDTSKCDSALESKIISNISLNNAASVAQCVIAATEKEAEKPPAPPSGIGGPIDVFTITKAGVKNKRVKAHLSRRKR